MARAPSRAAADTPAPEPDRVEGHPHPRETAALYGQEAAERRFLDAWAGGRLHHAWLIRGPAGIGKATLAYRIARALIAQAPTGGLFGEPETPPTLDAPENDPVRQRIVAQSEPRLFVLRRRPDDKGRLRTVITVDDVRALRGFLGLSATDGGWRVVIVDPADEMNRNAANALLKFLEEPPAQTVFLLISHAPAGLLPTIRSRCRTLDLQPLGPVDLARALGQAGAEIPAGAETALAELSGGSAGQALRLVAGDGLALYARIVRLFEGGRGIDRGAMTDLAERCAGRANADTYRLLLQLTQILVARLARAAATGAVPPEAAPGEAALIAAIARTPRQAAPWAEALAVIGATTRHAVAVNLDPAQTVLNTFLELDATIGRVRAAAA
ncbi:MAG TPA: DNA polymerase III subunit delta' [Paracoccaceae bacterium]|nr:DNA polymerase III subunit delta' [Paracoccaceae bacterium]